MHYFFVNEKLQVSSEVELAAEDLNHALRVLRLRVGSEIVIADGRGQAHQAIINDLDQRRVSALLGEILPSNEPALQITLVQAVLKGDKMDLVVRQSIELGVTRIVPLITARTIPQRDAKKDEKRLQRWQSKVRSAAAQCRRSFLPEVEPVQSLRTILPHLAKSKTIIPWEGEKKQALKDLLGDPAPSERSVFLLIGPEGGFDRDEVEAVCQAGATAVHLGPRILRSETAAVAAITMVQSAWGDLSGKEDLI